MAMHPLSIYHLETVSDLPAAGPAGARLKRDLKALLAETEELRRQLAEARQETQDALRDAEEWEAKQNKDLAEVVDELRSERDDAIAQLQRLRAAIKAALQGAE
jgi:uncharacterized coiled-coil DUF342 family protein